MAKEEQKDFLGRGWSFPPTFGNGGRTLEMTSDVEDIKRSLEILLSTDLGERVMLPTYGCNLEKLLFEPVDQTLKTYMADLIKTAILYHEPRIDVNSVSLGKSLELEGVVDIEVEFTIRTTNSRYNFVYPFYTNEADLKLT